MKLPEHVDGLRILIETAFDKQFARLGLGKASRMDIERIPESLHKPPRAVARVRDASRR